VVKGDKAVVTARVGSEDGPQPQGGKPAYQQIQAYILAAENNGSLRPRIHGPIFPPLAAPDGGTMFLIPESSGLSGPEVAVYVSLGNPYLLAHPGGGEFPPFDKLIDGILFNP
jgi:hypothetical protein